jgi:hypothetical protein
MVVRRHEAEEDGVEALTNCFYEHKLSNALASGGLYIREHTGGGLSRT